MRRLRKVSGALTSTVLGVSGLAVIAQPSAADHPISPPCMVVTQSTVLTGDVGPCNGHGIVVTADNVTLDLNGFTVRGANQEMEQVGVLLRNVRGVTVKNGTVTGFDAGVAIEEGGSNTVTGITATRNVNDMIEAIDPRSIVIPSGQRPTEQQRHAIARVTCDYGDGITTFDSSNNTITGNIVTENGPYSGISLVGDSNGNKVGGNQVHDNDLLNNGVVDAAGNPVFVQGGRHVPAGTPGATRPQSMCGATEVGTPGMGRGREVQSIGIRVEGPGADENVVDANTVTKGGLAGISFHSYVQVPASPVVPVGSSNRHNVVSNNDVSRTGEDTNQVDTFADGIASLASGPTGTVTRPSDTNTIVRNNSHNNFRHGISLGRLSFGNTVDKNVVNDNGGSGVWVAGPVAPQPSNPSFDPRGAHDNTLTRNHGRGNGEYDGTDMNPGCDNNLWKANNFRTFNQPCVVDGKSGSAPGRLKPSGAGETGGGGMGHRH